jgi:hypothetical protein
LRPKERPWTPLSNDKVLKCPVEETNQNRGDQWSVLGHFLKGPFPISKTPFLDYIAQSPSRRELEGDETKVKTTRQAKESHSVTCLLTKKGGRTTRKKRQPKYW